MNKRRRFGRKGIVYLGIAAVIAALNTAAWNSTTFADWYIAWIFPVWVNTYGRITGIFPFSVGEWLLAGGVILAILALLLGIVWGILGLGMGFRRMAQAVFGAEREVRREEQAVQESAVQKTKEGVLSKSRKEASPKLQEGQKLQEELQLKLWAALYRGLRKFSRGFYSFFVWTFLAVSMIMTLNCFILYHASTFSEHYFGEEEEDYTLEELIAVYNMVAEQCNELSGLMDRDETGMVLYRGSIGKDGEILDMADMARELMGQLGETYSQLDGYYPRPKALLSSDFMCQQYMQGYYFPFSMEANYNDVMHILNIPSTMCHELAHLRGYIYEDEANFIGYLACVQSEDLFFRYAGYLSVLNYLNNDIYYAWRDNRETYEKAAAVILPVTVEEQVWTDNIFVTQEEWDRINGKALIDTEIVDKAADIFIDANLKINGIADGKISYSRVVKLLLQYYRSSFSQTAG